ncbi:protein kinase C iota type-like [Fukomys damarensis]|uniref:protein kinase C n=1 Tax=Fukomys damarensis TaxID=885580 RepID=A0A091E3F5_FUKDA|nr:protein kinase C iota type-like [Fukomys damarensis]KFO37882.1 Protein kinase C iota type [Fukomys damarensis]
MTASFENYSSLEGLRDKDCDVWCLDNKQLFTTDWAEEEGDFHTVSPQLELEEAFKLSGLKNSCSQNELLIHPSPCIPEHPKVPCPEEKKSILHRAAGRWRKLLCANGHASQASGFSRRTHCAVCTEHVGGLGLQAYKCASCKLSVHKKCHEFVTIECGQHSLPSEPMVPVDPSSVASDPAQTAIPCDLSSHKALGQIDEENEAGNARENGKASPRLSLQDFDMLRVIGRGSYGKVLQVQLKKSDRMHSMKTVKKELVNTDRIGTEKHILQQISNHPFLVGLHSCFQTESRLFFVLDYVNGGDLMFHMQKQRTLPEEHARFYSAEIGLAFNYLHQKGILYRNLKLDNILLDSEGHIKLTDYCICKEGLEPGDMTSTFCGTPNYLAPEIIRGEDYGFSVDWWTLGMLMYEMMIGESPFHLAESSDNPGQNSNNNLLQVTLERKIHMPHYLSIKAASVLKSFLNRDPKERLGCRPQRGLADIQEHPFFQDVDWEMLERKQVVPPFKPNMSGGFSLDNFDSQFTDEPVWLTPDDNDIVREIEGCEFAGFEYVNHLMMYEEEWV